ncbi:DUF2124 domain-containing protein [Methanofollis fontis]|uniref:DUF2124 domain-containing protein n=1 Tax=Methanofollis fontis TaxID=2052832 RepID=A0A483CZD8_9EURY|nr:DUF2124 domain-containing protein [Methanofollis fontis]TAJ45439.1 DUF2124 domain-containing protein [Methanofollis fontis]
MEEKERLKGVPGMLRPFKAWLKGAALPDGAQIVYYGCPGTCTPFIELLAFATRDLPYEQVFVPYLDEEKARTIRAEKDVGMQIGDAPASLSPAVAVIMGGLAMPNIPVEAGAAAEMLARHPEARRIGVCFMSMFEQAGWLDTLDFDLLIDAAIDPVTVYA